MTRMRYVKMDRIMNHMLIHALREVFRQEKEQGLPVDTTRDLVLKLAEQEEGKLYLTEAEHSKSVEALNQLRAGLCGHGLGATPSAIVNMTAVKEKYGMSRKAFMIVPIVGAFLVDIIYQPQTIAFIKYFVHALK